MPFSAKFSMTFQTEILSTETSDSLKRMIILKSFDSVLYEDEWMRMHVFFFIIFFLFFIFFFANLFASLVDENFK